MQQLLTGTVRFKEFVKKSGTKKTNHGRIPADWDLNQLQEVASINSSSLTESTPPDEKFRYIDLGSVDDGVVTLPLKAEPFHSLPSRARRVLQKDDVAMATVRPYLNRHFRCDFEAKGFVCSTGFAVISPKNARDSHLLYQFLFVTVHRSLSFRGSTVVSICG